MFTTFLKLLPVVEQFLSVKLVLAVALLIFGWFYLPWKVAEFDYKSFASLVSLSMRGFGFVSSKVWM